jgi:hypothetical protein
VFEIKRLLTRLAHRVYLISGFSDILKRLQDNHYGIIIVTDSLSFKPSRDTVSDLKIFFPHSKVLYLVDQVTEERERALRSGGLIFLGTYDHFLKNHHDILYAAEKIKRCVSVHP